MKPGSSDALFIKRLEMLKVRSGCTEQEFAARCGISEEILREYSRRSVYVRQHDIIEKIAKACNVPFDWLLMGAGPSGNDFTDSQIRLLCAKDPEVIEVVEDHGRAVPVVRTYDTLDVHLKFFCIHCNTFHLHGRGGNVTEYPFALGRRGMAGDRVAHCVAQNSPFRKNGYILEVVGTVDDMPKKNKRGGTRICRHCGKYYSAAFKTCSCGSFNPIKEGGNFQDLQEEYQTIYLLDQSSAVNPD